MTIHFDLAMSDYLAHPGIGSSLLKKMTITPADFKAARDQPSDETAATMLGTAVHTLILEPKEFFKRYALQPADWGPLNAGQGYKLWNAFKAENEGLIPIKWADACYLNRVRQVAEKCAPLQAILKSGRPEVTAFCDWFGISLKARNDFLQQLEPDRFFMWDLKSTSEDINDDNLFNIIYRNGYHFQAGHHKFVFELEMKRACISGFGWIFITTQNSAIHIRIVKCPYDLLMLGAADHMTVLKRLKECFDNDDWPGYSVYVDLDIPNWVRSPHG